MLRKKFSIADNKPKSVILGLFVVVVLLLLFFMIPIFRNDNVINVENNIERSPVKVSLYFELAEINNKQQGNVESEQSFATSIPTNFPLLVVIPVSSLYNGVEPTLVFDLLDHATVRAPDAMDMAILLHDGLCWTYPTSICHVRFL